MTVAAPIGTRHHYTGSQPDGIEREHGDEIEGVSESDGSDGAIAQATHDNLVHQTEAQNEYEFEADRYSDRRHPLTWAGRQ